VIARVCLRFVNRGMKSYLQDMLLQFDVSGAKRIDRAREYIQSLARVSGSGNGVIGASTDYGSYTLAKHIFLHEYLGPFFSIGGLNFRRLVYIDMFAGPGINAIDRDGSTYMTPGSPLVTYLYRYRTKHDERNERFDSYYFFESNKQKADTLQERLGRIRGDFKLDEEGHVFPTDSQTKVWDVMKGEINNLKNPKKVGTRADRGLLFLLFIDPEGLGLEFGELVKLLQRYVATADGEDSQHYFTADVIYTAPTHWVKQSGKSEYLRTYCGVDPSRDYTDEELADIMAGRIKEEVGGKCFVISIPVRNSKNALQYHIFCVTKSSGAAKAAESLRAPLRLRSRDLQSALDSVLGGGSSLDDHLG
jgi:three-Cys-motif partner protein